MRVREAAAATLLLALALAGCENIPYYDESLGLFSRSGYDPEVEAIEERTPPPQDSPVLAPGGEGASADPMPDGAIVPAASLQVEPPAPVAAPAFQARVAEPERAAPLAAAPDRAEVRPASLAPPERIAPPMGFARSKRVIYGANRGPFQTGTVRTPR
jgi:hypothetical protein